MSSDTKKTVCADVSDGTPSFVYEDGVAKYVLVDYPRFRSARLGMPALVVISAALGIALIVSSLKKHSSSI